MSHPLLTAPIAPTLFRLAGPTTGVMCLQVLVALVEIWIISSLGTTALAGTALVFPAMAMMVNNANGGIGGGVASALARALGAGRTEDACALVPHAIVLALFLGLCFTGLAWTVGPAFYQLLGGSGSAFQQALAFSNAWYGAATAIWLNACFAALLRGSGDAATPARIAVISSMLYVPLAAVLALGLGSWSGLGIVGVAIASNITAVGAAFVLGRKVLRGQLGFVPPLIGVRPRLRLFSDILRVGAMSVLTSVTSSLTLMSMTGLIGRFGALALAGYGIGVRLEFMLMPLAYGIGTGLTTLIGIAAGADAWERAVRVAWIGSGFAFIVFGVVGMMLALLAGDWSALFTNDLNVAAASAAYVSHIAPFWGFLGLGLTLYFASQGAGRMITPLVASAVRLTVSTAGGWYAVETLRTGLDGVFGMIAVGTIAYGSVNAGRLFIAPWRARVTRRRARIAPE